MQRNHNIAVIDSGAGGLSIVAEVLKLNPGLDITYVADKAAFPYGELENPHLIERLIKLVTFIVSREQPDLIIIACNTASTIALTHLRDTFALPFVGVVPAVKPAALATSSGSIAVLATPITVSTPYTNELVERFAKDCSVSFFASTELVRVAEDYVHTGEIDHATINDLIKRILEKNQQIDTLVLACTHFPLIRTTIKEAFVKAAKQLNPSVTTEYLVLDSGNAIARRVQKLLKLDQQKQEHGRSDGASLSIIVTESSQSQTDDELKQIKLGYGRYLKKSATSSFDPMCTRIQSSSLGH